MTTPSNTQEVINKVTNSTLEQAGAEMVTTVTDVLKATSQAFPEIAGKSFEYYAQYVFAQGVSDLLIGIFLLLAVALQVGLVWSLLKEVDKKESSVDGSDVGGILFLLLVTTIFTVLGMLNYLSDGVINMIAPEGAVVNEIIRNLK